MVDAFCTVELSGELDLATIAEAETVVQVACAVANVVILDLRGLRFMDMPGLRLIMRLDAVARRQALELRVVAGDGIVQRLLALTGVDAVMNVVDTLAPSERFHRAEYAVIATDLGGLVTVWNTEAERLYGWSALEVLGRSIMGVTVGPEDRQVAEEIMRQVQRAGYWDGRFEVRSKAGRRFAARVRDVLVTDDSGSVVGFVGVSAQALTADAHAKLIY